MKLKRSVKDDGFNDLRDLVEELDQMSGDEAYTAKRLFDNGSTDHAYPVAWNNRFLRLAHAPDLRSVHGPSADGCGSDLA